MTTQPFIITTEMATMIREGAAVARTATATKKKAAERIASAGGRGHFFTKAGMESGQISKETFEGLQRQIAAGLLTKEEFALWAGGSKAAAAAGLQKERNVLTSNVSTYLSSFRGMIETAYLTLHPAEKAEAAEGKEADGKAEAPITGADIRKRLLDIITDVAASNLQNREGILEALNEAEALMEW